MSAQRMADEAHRDEYVRRVGYERGYFVGGMVLGGGLLGSAALIWLFIRLGAIPWPCQ